MAMIVMTGIQPAFAWAAYGAMASAAACQFPGEMIGAVMPCTRARPGKVCIRRSGGIRGYSARVGQVHCC